jgi:hypothetical protein
MAAITGPSGEARAPSRIHATELGLGTSDAAAGFAAT